MGSSTTDSDSNVWTDMVDMVGHLVIVISFGPRLEWGTPNALAPNAKGFARANSRPFFGEKKKQKFKQISQISHKFHLHSKFPGKSLHKRLVDRSTSFSTLRTLRRLPTSARLWMYFQYTACGSRSLVTVRHLWALRKCNQKTWKMCKNVWCFQRRESHGITTSIL